MEGRSGWDGSSGKFHRDEEGGGGRVVASFSSNGIRSIYSPSSADEMFGPKTSQI